MKTKMLWPILLFLTAVLCLSGGCTATPPEYLMYQRYPFTVQADAEYTAASGYHLSCAMQITMRGEYDGRVTLLSPYTLEGYTFDYSPSGAVLSFDTMTLPLASAEINRALYPIRLFSLSTDRLCEVRVPEKDSFTGASCTNIASFTLGTLEEESVSKETAGAVSAGNCEVYLSTQTGLPVAIQADFGGDRLTLNITGFCFDPPAAESDPLPNTES